MITNTNDIIDSCDILTRIEELEEELATAQAFTSDGSTQDEAREELKQLQEVAEQAKGVEEPLVRESYFVDYIKELIKDCYEMPEQVKSGNWPYRHMHLNYKAAAEEVKIDYAVIDFDGVTYLQRGH